jgi:hypothetical protein
MRRLTSLVSLLGLATMLAACPSVGVHEGLQIVGGCQADTECPAEYFCVSGACQAVPGDPPAEDPPDAGPVATPDAGHATPPDAGTAASVVCTPCTSSRDCGGNGNYCLQEDTGDTYCGKACTRASDCAADETCEQLQNASGQVVGSNCYPTSGTCAGAVTTPDAGPATHPDAGTPPTPDAGTPPTPDAGTAPTCTDTWANYAGTFFSNNCAGCHSFATSYTRVAGDLTGSRGIRNEISSRNMPPRGISTSERTRILAWIDCGAHR